MQIVWYGHSTFKLMFDGKTVLIDPFFTGNPAFAGDAEKAWAGTTHILVTHGHSDHVGDAVAISKATGAPVATNYDLCLWMASKGLEKFDPMNTGGTVDMGGFTVTLVRADHSSSVFEDGHGTDLGSANGLIIKAKGQPTVYAMGDTDIFSDMALLNEIHQPDVLLVPIGDRFTMGPEVAAMAVTRYFKPKAVIPCHYATFPLLVPDADRFVAALGGKVQAVVPQKGMPVTL